MPSANQMAQTGHNEASERSKESTKETPANNQVVTNLQSNNKDAPPLDEKSPVKAPSIDASLRAIMAQAGKLYSDSNSTNDD